MKRLIPYRTLVGDVSLDVREARLDGVNLHLGMISAGHRVVALHQVEREDWEEARLTIRLHVPRQEIEEGTWSDVTCVAVAKERRTNARTVSLLRRETEGWWTGVVTLQRDHHRSEIELTGHVVATVDGVKGRLIGSTDRHWTVDLHARTPAQQSFIKIVSLDFADEKNSHLNPYRADPWTVEAAGDDPVVYLNTGFEGLVPLLNGGDRAVRDSLSAQIAADAWTALFNAAVYTAGSEEDGQPHWPGSWQEAVLRKILPDMFIDRSPDDALVEVVTRRRAGEGGGDLQTRLLHAAGRQALTTRRLGGLIRALSRRDGGSS